MLAIIIIIAILSIIMLLPLGIDGGYCQGTVSVNAKIGPLLIKILPSHKKEKQKSLKPKKEKNKKTKDEKKVDKKSKIPMDKGFLLGIIKEGLRALSNFRRKLSMDYFRFHYIFASDDPFNTAIGYGKASAITGILMPFIDNAFNIKEKDFGYHCDFFIEKPVIDIWLTATIRVWELIYIAGVFLTAALKLYIKNRRKDRTIERNELNGKTSHR